MLGVAFDVDTSHSVDETIPDGVLNAAEQVPEYLSQKKAEAYQPYLSSGSILITADTVVILDDDVLGKPIDIADAKSMLKRLSGRTHKVVTGVTIVDKEKSRTFAETTFVEFGVLADTEIDYYVETFRPLDKAGAYGIQEWIGAVAVKGIHGSYYNVMGLPINRLYRELKSW
jgi:septum formation protein